MEMNKTGNVELTGSSGPVNVYQVGWQCPSNIALVKYWGKSGNQIPMNPSLSMTLHGSVTRTVARATLKTKGSEKIQLKYLFEGRENPTFQAKVLVLLEKLQNEFLFLKDYNLEIESSNTFPHSAGIASSASSMAALALCLLSLDAMITAKKLNYHAFFKKASHIARLGSGSASRSVYGGFTIWGKHTGIPGVSDMNAIPLPVRTHPLFDKLCDSILVVSQDEKSVSSRAGHEKMEKHVFKKARIKQAAANMARLIKALGKGDWDAFSSVVENEALSLHGLMLSSDPGFLLIRPNTILAIEKINDYRTQSKAKITYTLDAGPNLHVLYPDEDKIQVQKFINQELAPLCTNNYVIHDQMGKGPFQIS
jgi:diphosphomevalonate decarboxylase